MVALSRVHTCPYTAQNADSPKPPVTQVCGSLKIPSPAAEFTSNTVENQLTLHPGEFHVHLSQLNALIEL